jgi:small conductance mechanosensitive channel
MPLFRRKRFDALAPAHRARTMTLQTLQRARDARRELVLVVPLMALTLLAYVYRKEVFGVDVPVRVAAAMVLVVLGWALARDLGRWVAPALFRRVDPGTAGTIGFMLRLTFLGVAALVALRIAGLDPKTLAVGGAVTAVVFGLAAQQTLGNLIAGLVLISARPFRIGDRVRLQGGGLAGQLEGTVVSLGLLYTTFAQGEDSIMVPNNVVLTSAVVPLREPAAVNLRARLRPDVKPTVVQALLEEAITTPLRAEPHIGLEEVDSDEVIVRIAATPESEADGPRLADEILAAMASVTREVTVQERANGKRPASPATGSDPATDADPAVDPDKMRVSKSAHRSDPSTQEHES